MADPVPGDDLVRDRYEVLGVVGRGGQGQVFLALDHVHHRQVALKARHLRSEVEREALLAEARILLSVRPHQSLPIVREDFVVGDRYYLVMDWIEGRDLSRVLAAEGLPGLDYEYVLGWLEQCAEALDHLHDHDPPVVHGDVKPANLVLGEDGRVVLVDFGIAARISGVPAGPWGSPDYTAPEAPTADFGTASDVYSLAVTAYVLLTGSPPRPEIRPRLTGLGGAEAEGVLRGLRRGLAFDPVRRPPSASALVEAIHAGRRSGRSAADQHSRPGPTKRAPAATPGCPYRGLFAFGEEDAPLFFGRDRDTDSLVEIVSKRPLVAVVGPSGTGKSSLVWAGLVPRLRSEGDWLVVGLRPGARPFRSLAEALVPHLEPTMSETDRIIEVDKLGSALRDRPALFHDVTRRLREKTAAARLLLVVDQFEELYTLVQDTQERHDFVEFLADVPAHTGGADTRSLTVVLTLRADFLGHALNQRSLADALQQADVKLGPMTRDELRAAIEEPAARRGVTLEDGLTGRILDTLAHAPGNLPLLEFALTLLWDAQEDGQLTHLAYDRMGGVEEALAGYADAVFSELSPEDQDQARRVLLQLVHPGEGTKDTRRQATRAEIGPDQWGLVMRLASSRLVVTGRSGTGGDDLVEFAHEALLAHWSRLRQWIEADREFRAWQDRLRGGLRQWEASGHDEGALLRGVPLAEARDWLARRDTDLSSIERSFIDASTLATADAEEARSRQQAGYRRLKRSATALLAALLIVAAAAAVSARRDSRTARRLQLVSVAQALAAEVDGQLGMRQDERAALLARQAERFDARTGGSQRPEVDRALRRALGVDHFSRIVRGHRGGVSAIAFSPDGSTLASGASGGVGGAVGGEPDDPIVRLHDLRGARTQDIVLQDHRGAVSAVKFSPDGARLVSAGEDGVLRLWHPDEPEASPVTLHGHDASIFAVAFSPDGDRLVSAGEDGTLRLWHPDEPEAPPLSLAGHEGDVYAVAFSPDGDRLVSAGEDGTVRLWDPGQPETPPLTLQGHEGPVYTVAFSPDGDRLVSAGEDGTVRLWHPDEPDTPPLALDGHDSAVYTVAFSSDGATLASAGNEGTVLLRSPAALDQPATVLHGHTGAVTSVAFSPDGEVLASGSRDKSVRLWRRDTSSPIRTRLTGHEGAINSVAFAPDGDTLVTGSDDHTVRVWHARDGWTSTVLSGHDDKVRWAAFSHDGAMLASASGDGTIRLWDLRRPRGTPDVFRADGGDVHSVAFSPDAESLVSGHDDGGVRMWRTAAPSDAPRLLGRHTDRVKSVAFSPDGRWIASGGDDDLIRIWDAGRPQRRPQVLTGHANDLNSLAFSPDGRRLASGGHDRVVRIWDVGRPDAEPVLLEGHTDEIEAVAFSPDGQVVASAADDATIRLWDPDDAGVAPIVIADQGDEIEALAFSPDGTRLASAGDARTLVIERLGTAELSDLVCATVGRDLTRAEWQEFVGAGVRYEQTCPDGR